VEGFNKARAERVGDLLRRYMWARARCVGGETPALQLSELAGRLQWGPCEFDGVRVELNLEPPIVWDREQPAFFHAIVECDHSAMPGIEALDDWRKYVYSNGPMPTQRGARFPLATSTGVRQHSERIDVV
jgi:hypothetical protein